MPQRARPIVIGLILGGLLTGSAPGCGSEEPVVIKGSGSKQRLKNREDDEVKAARRPGRS